MKIIWADHDPSWGISSSSVPEEAPVKEEVEAEVALVRELSKQKLAEEEDAAQEKSPEKGAKGFGWFAMAHG